MTRLLPADKSLFPDNSSAVISSLRPTEFAYLVRNGDISHAIAVLAVDLMQRAVKGRASESASTESASTEIVLAVLPADEPAYEAGMWTLVRQQVVNWTLEQKESLMLESLKKNPVAYTKRLGRIYYFFTHTLKSFVVQVARDPRHLRRYFSVAGILRLVSDFSLAGYQQIFEDQLKTDLRRRGLLVSDNHKQKMANLCFAIGVALVLSVMVVFFLLVPVSVQSVSYFFVACAVTFGARFLYGLKDLLPYLGDVLQVLRFLHRRSWRLVVLRFVSRYIRVVLALSCLFIYGIPMILTGFILQLSNLPPSKPLILLCLLSSMVLLGAINLGFTGVLIMQEEYATAYGITLVQKLRKEVAGLSPLEAFMQMLQSRVYEQTFSDLVAIYGIETLLFLA